MPVDSDDWLAFDKVKGLYEANKTRDLLRASKRFRNVEAITGYHLIQAEGVDAMIEAEVQVAGGWSPTEQEALRAQVVKIREMRQPGQNPRRAEHRARMKFVEQMFQDAMDAYIDFLKLPGYQGTELGSRKIPELFKISILNGATRLEEVSTKGHREMFAIRWPMGARSSAVYRPRVEAISAERVLTLGAVLCAMIELWEVAEEEARLAAIEKVRAHGVATRKRTP